MIVKLAAAAAVGGALVAGVPVIAPAVGAQLQALMPGSTAASETAQTTPVASPNREAPEATGGGAILDQTRTVPASRSQAISSYAPVVREAAPAVVNVYARSVQQGRVMVDPFWGGRMQVPERAQQSQGSGVIVRDDGVIVTNNHVVEGATELVVVLGDRREFPARVLLADPRTDLAVLRIDPGSERLPSLRFADTTQAQVGDQVLAIGNPFGVGQTVTGGIISALARTDVGITDYSFFIQTDASINPGNSGGALVDMNGDLVGINTAIFSRSGTSAGVGFAIPSEMVRTVVNGAVTEGRVVRSWSGVRGQAVDAEIARSMGLARPAGVLVTEVWQGSAAAQAGLRRGDVITRFGGVDITDESGLRYQAALRRPGEQVEFGFVRGGQTLTARGALSVPPGDPTAEGRRLTGRSSFDGVSVAAMNPALADAQGLDPFTKGVVVTAVAPGTNAQRARFQPGDVVLDVNGQAVTSVDELEGLIGSGRQGEVTIQRGNRQIRAVLFI